MLTDAHAQAGGISRDGPAPGNCDLFRQVFSAEPSAVRVALRRAVARFARRITPDDAGTLELALAEVLNNVVEHGYAGLPPGPVRLDLRRAGAALHCLVEDQGHPMPGRILPEGAMPPVATTAGGLAEGGWGWALIRDLTTDICYTRENGRNRLTFRIPLTGHHGRAAAKMPQCLPNSA